MKIFCLKDIGGIDKLEKESYTYSLQSLRISVGLRPDDLLGD